MSNFQSPLEKNCSCQGTGLLYDVVELHSDQEVHMSWRLPTFIPRVSHRRELQPQSQPKFLFRNTALYYDLQTLHVHVGSGGLLVVNSTVESLSKGHAKKLRR